MGALVREAIKRGYSVVNHGYPSRRARIADHASQLRTVVEEVGESGGRIHFVTHSLGGIVVRAMLANRSAWPKILGRVVMLSPPNQGSELAELLATNRVFQLALGPSARELGTGPESMPNQLGAVDFELGVITGDRSFLPITKRIFGGPGDGKVSVERARVEGMRDFLVVRRSHTFIMRAPDVITAVFDFLESGAFTKSSAVPSTRP